MSYFAGIFDAEGTISMCPNGAFSISIEVANESIPNLFKGHFQGSIYERKRDNRKRTWSWKINSISDQCLNFIDQLLPYSIAKKPQLLRLKDYLEIPRFSRREVRKTTISTLKQLKIPLPLSLQDVFVPTIICPETTFFEWLAGFVDGDGNIVCNEYIDPRNGFKYFAHQLAVANTFPDVIRFIKQRLEGNVRITKGTLHPIFRWTCKRNIEKSVCEKIYPFLKVKKEQCALLMEFIEFPKKIRGCDIPLDDRNRMYEIIRQIKHLNSL